MKPCWARAVGVHERTRVPGARAREADRGAASEAVACRPRRQRLFVRAPAELRRLQAFREKAFDRPGVDELSARLGIAGALGIALGDVDALDAGALHQASPVLARLRLDEVELELAGDVDQRLLHHPRRPCRDWRRSSSRR
jgi:hypothetical protein